MSFLSRAITAKNYNDGRIKQVKETIMKALDVIVGIVAVAALAMPAGGEEGTITSFNVEEGVGFITPGDGGPNLLVEDSGFLGVGTPVAGDEVGFFTPDAGNTLEVSPTYYWRIDAVDEVSWEPVDFCVGDVTRGTKETIDLSVTNLSAGPIVREDMQLSMNHCWNLLWPPDVAQIGPGETMDLKILGCTDLVVGCTFDLTLSICGEAVLTVTGTIVPPAQSYIEAVIAELEQILADYPGTPLADKIEDVLAKLLTAHYELTKDPPDNQAAAGNIEGAVGDLEAALDDGLLDFEQGIGLLDMLTYAARMLATDAIDAAIAAGADPEKIAEAGEYLVQGDEHWVKVAFKDAVGSYKDALACAEGAEVGVVDPPTETASAWFVVAPVQTGGISAVEGDEVIVWIVGGRKGPEATSVTPA